MEVAMRRIWLGFGMGWAALGCNDGGQRAPAYEARVEAAHARIMEATCACSWSTRLRDQCLRYESSGLEAGCDEALSERLAAEEAAYAECVAHSTELYARCLESTDCDARSATCALDVRLDCGPVPDALDPALAVCLPHFRCQIGQEVSLDRRCNGIVDCLDRSDERGCPD